MIMKLSFICLLLIMTLFLFSHSALTQALSLVLFSVWIGVLSGISNTLWLFALIVLVFSSGMMVIFLYLTSLASQDTNKFSINDLSLILILTLSTLSLFSLNTSPHNSKLSLLSNYSGLNQASVTVICIYLLISLFCVFKITQGFKGSLMISKFL